MTTIYGIPNCDTMKKARTWLEGQGVPHDFHDYKKAGISAEKLDAWADAVGWELLLNKAGTTFRKLPDHARENIDCDKAIMLMIDQPSMIKRPLIDTGARRVVGFKPTDYEALFA